MILYSQLSLEPGEPSFPDVKVGSWYEEAVNALAAAGFLAGYSDGTFRPNRAVTRAECAAILAKLSGETAAEPATFPDVQTHWAREAIALAQEKGWVSGYTDGTFRPNSSVTRSEAVVMLNHFLGRVPDAAAIAALLQQRTEVLTEIPEKLDFRMNHVSSELGRFGERHAK